eukprot:Clim_evm1s93 gene=Clim_evmTU1s93
MSGNTGYEPLLTPKEFGEDIWIVDGPSIKFYGLPFPTRMTVVRLSTGDLWVHSPIEWSTELQEKIQTLGNGQIKYLIAPNWIHYAYIADWHRNNLNATVWVAPGVVKRAYEHNIEMPPADACNLLVVGPESRLLTDDEVAETAMWDPNEKNSKSWDGIKALFVSGSKIHQEVVFFHEASGTLILTDLVESFELNKSPWYLKPLLWMVGVTAPDGKMPPDMAATFKRKDLLKASLEIILEWDPQCLIIAHGNCSQADANARLRRAWRHVL